MNNFYKSNALEITACFLGVHVFFAFVKLINQGFRTFRETISWSFEIFFAPIWPGVLLFIPIFVIMSVAFVTYQSNFMIKWQFRIFMRLLVAFVWWLTGVLVIGAMGI